MLSFSELMTQFSALHALAQPDRVIGGDWITVADTPFCFIEWQGAPHPGFQIYADCGPIALTPVPGGTARQMADVTAFLLETNLYASSNGGPVFALSEKDRHVICIHRMYLDGLTAEGLNEFVRGVAAFSREWQNNPALIIKQDTTASAARARISQQAAFNDRRLRRV